MRKPDGLRGWASDQAMSVAILILRLLFLIHVRESACRAQCMAHRLSTTFQLAASTPVCACVSAFMQIAADMTTLQYALFGPQPKCLVYVTRPGTDGQGSIKYYLVPQNLRCTQPRLWLLHPTADAPANTPPLCVLMDRRSWRFLQWAEPLLHYTALAPGKSQPDSVGDPRAFRKLQILAVSERWAAAPCVDQPTDHHGACKISIAVQCHVSCE